MTSKRGIGNCPSSKIVTHPPPFNADKQTDTNTQIRTYKDTIVATSIPLPVHRVMYYQGKQIAKAQVINTGIIPTFTLKPSHYLVRTICPKCLNSSIKGELQVELGRLAREMAEENITLWMSWDLHSSRKVECKNRGLTWLYSTESSTYDHLIFFHTVHYV